jgi:hypothetical protein
MINALRQGFLLLLMFSVGGYFLYFTTPCKTPVHYAVGSLDSRFELSEAELLSALKDAEAIWESATGENLFEYKEGARLSINLVFDTRQAITQQNNEIKEEIEETSQTAEEVKAAYERATAQYESAKADYLRAQAAHNSELKSYNETVDYWNARGGAPPKEYADLQKQKSTLQESETALEKKRVALNALVREVNTLSTRYNSLAHEFNAGVSEINKTAGREFEEGLYVKTAWSERIDIYEYSDRAELVRVLAHELGHSLGLEHNQNPDSIMFELNESENVTPTQEDLAGLRETCKR